jgi:hypothetical protein
MTFALRLAMQTSSSTVLLDRLLFHLHEAGLEYVVIPIQKEDAVTAPYLQRVCDTDSSDLKYGTRKMKVRVVRLPDDCHGSADALRFLSRDVDDETNKEQQQRIIPKSSHLIVLPSDLILEGNLLKSKRRRNNASYQH